MSKKKAPQELELPGAITNRPTITKGISPMTVNHTPDRRHARRTIEFANKIVLTILAASLTWMAFSTVVDQLIAGVVLWAVLGIAWRRAIVRERRAARLARLWAVRAYATAEALAVELDEELAA